MKPVKGSHLDPATVLNTPTGRDALAKRLNKRHDALVEKVCKAQKETKYWAIGSAFAGVILTLATVLLFAENLRGPQGVVGPEGPQGPKGDAATTEQIVAIVDREVGKLPKPLTAEQIRDLVGAHTTPYDDSSLRKQIEELKENATKKTVVEDPKPGVADVRPVEPMEEQRLNREVTDKDVKWISYQGYMLPIWRVNDRGVTGPTEPNLQKPKGYESWEWTVIRGKSANWALAR